MRSGQWKLSPGPVRGRVALARLRQRVIVEPMVNPRGSAAPSGNAARSGSRATRTTAGRGSLLILAAMAGWLGLAARVPAQGLPETAAEAVRRADAVVDAEGARALTREWQARVERNADDRVAALGVAVLAAGWGDARAADSEYRALLALRPPGVTGDNVSRYAHLERGILFSSEGRWLAAAQTLDTVVAEGRAAHDSTVEATALVRLIPLEIRWRDPHIDAQLARADSISATGATGLRASALCAHAMALNAAHKPGGPEAAKAGSELAQQGNALRAKASCDFITATARTISGDMDRGIADLRRVINEATLIHDYRLRATARQWLGYALLNLGDYGDAYAALQSALDEGRASGNLAAVGWSELNLAELSNDVGDRAGARRHIARGRAALSSTQDSSGLGILRRIEGSVALRLGDTATARGSAEDALRAAQQTGRVPDLLMAHTALGNVDAREGRWDAALTELAVERRLITERRLPAYEPSISGREGVLLLEEGHPRRALAALRDAQAGFDSSQHLLHYEFSEEIASSLIGLGDTTGAIAAVTRANRQIDAWRATLSDAELRVLAFQVVNVIGGLRTGSAEVIAAAARSGRVATAFELAEARRARELADQMRRAEAFRARSGGGAPGGPLTGPHAVTPVIAVSPAIAGARVALAELQRSVPDDSTAVLEYVTGRMHAPSTVLVVSRQRTWAHVLMPADSLTDGIARLDAAIEDNMPVDGPARALGDRIIAPVLADLPSRIVRLVVIPDGALHRVPFTVLEMADGRPLIERFAVSMAPSATVLVSLWRRARVVREPTILAFGDPVQPNELVMGATTATQRGDGRLADGGSGAQKSDLRASDAGSSDTSVVVDRDAASALDAAGALPRLPWTADEAQLVGQFATRSTVRLRGDASAAFLESVPIEGFTIVHFATHSVVDNVAPTRSALALAPGGGQSGFVGPGDLQALHLTADLVVLSACRTARGAVVAGEGVRGLTAPFLVAGARSVLATQWRLNDRAAVPLVYQIYQGLARGLELSQAVQRAAIAARRRGAPVREWAVFTVVGDGTVHIPLRVPPRGRIPAWLAAAE